MGTLKDTDKLPTDANQERIGITVATGATVAKSYTDDDYSF